MTKAPTPQKTVLFRLFQVDVLKPTFDDITAASLGGVVVWAISVGLFYLLGWKIDVRLASILLVWCFWSSVSLPMGLRLGALKDLKESWRVWLAYAVIGLHLLLIFEIVWFFFAGSSA